MNATTLGALLLIAAAWLCRDPFLRRFWLSDTPLSLACFFLRAIFGQHVPLRSRFSGARPTSLTKAGQAHSLSAVIQRVLAQRTHRVALTVMQPLDVGLDDTLSI